MSDDEGEATAFDAEKDNIEVGPKSSSSKVDAVTEHETSSKATNPLVAPTTGTAATSSPSEQVNAAIPEYGGFDPDAVFGIFERKNVAKLRKMGGVSGIEKMLKTDVSTGVQASSLVERRKLMGWNKLPEPDPVSYLDFLIDAFKDPIIQLLCLSAVVSILFGMLLEDSHSGEVERETGWIEGTAILISISVVTLTGATENYNKAKKFEEMEKNQKVHQVQVCRDGEETTIDSTEIVTGDVIIVEGGIEMDCDCLYLSGRDFKCNESAMTGETDVVIKSAELDPFFLSGTLLEEGMGRLLVVAVGTMSYQGRMKSTPPEAEETPLQAHLSELAGDIGRIGSVVAGLLVLALVVKEVILIAAYDQDAHAASFLNFVVIAVTLIVVAIPEGLPLAVTICLAHSMNAMQDDNCLVRILASSETMGAATAVCSDKTGTLTTNQMTVVQGSVFDSEFMYTGYGLKGNSLKIVQIDRTTEPMAMARAIQVADEHLEDFCFAMAINSTASEAVIDGELTWIGNKTECGLLGFIKRVGKDFNEMRKRMPEDQKRIFTFNSTKKRMTTVLSPGADPSKLCKSSSDYSVYCKGASEMVLADCTHYYDCIGEVQELSGEKRREILDQITSMASQGNRTIGVARGSLPTMQCTDMQDGFPRLEPDDVPLTFMGIMGIQDPIREEVPAAVQECTHAGITVRMVTGDNINTAIAIAKKCGIFSDPEWDLAMTGEDFRNKCQTDKDGMFEDIPRLRILARSSPQDKYNLVEMLQELGEVVGVTGDGTNDSPALKRANVGFAMKCGTKIAHSAADMILLDNNFASVVNAVRWGRAVNDNVRKFLQYQLSVNFAGVLLTVVGSLASSTSKEPLTAVQLLWLNLIMDTLAALALATEYPDTRCLHRPPVYKQAPLMSGRMKSFIGVHSAFQFTAVLILLFFGHKWLSLIDNPDDSALECKDIFKDFYNLNSSMQASFNSTALDECRKACTKEGGSLSATGGYCQQGRTHSTVIFNTFIWLQILNIFNARKLYGEMNPFEGVLSRSRWFVIVLVIIVIFQGFAICVAGRFMGTVLLPWSLWLVCFGVALLELPVGLLVRLLPFDYFVPEFVGAKQAREQQLREKIAEKMQASRKDTFLSHDPSLKRVGTLFRK